MADALRASDRPDVQGLLASGYPHLPCAAYRLLRVREGQAEAARAWLHAQVGEVTTAVADTPTALNVAFTHEGLAALGFPADALRTFPNAFVEGMTSERRARLLGDAERGPSDDWLWGGATNPVHVLLLMYDATDAALGRQLARRAPGDGSVLEEVATLRGGRPRRAEAAANDGGRGDNREHFGFVDAAAQPVIRGLNRGRQRGNEVAPGEFILGHPDGFGKVASSPTIRGGAATDGLPPAADDESRRDLGRNGSYLVFRHLAQDVAGFWQAVTSAAAEVWPEDPDGPERLAAKLFGRWRCGAPLVLFPKADPARYDAVGRPDEERPINDFAYADLDPHGDRCPLGAHIRRANPRDALGPDKATALASTLRHRLLRRGRSFGDRIDHRALGDRLVDDRKRRGLYFICLNADLERQFEFVQQTWLDNPAFAGLHGEVDPIVGAHRASRGTFSVQAAPLAHRVPSVTDYVRVRGGAYFFLPGLRALAAITAPGQGLAGAARWAGSSGTKVPGPKRPASTL